MKNIINNTNEIKVNGNCKKVRNITLDILYDGVKYAAKANGVANSTMSVAIREGYLCNGSRFMFEDELHNNTDKLCAENAKANARANRAEAKLSEMEELRAKAKAYDKLMAEQEAKRKAEEKARKEEEARLERERKEEEKRKKLIAQKKDKIAQYEAEVERRKAKLAYAEQKLMCAEIELEALMDNEKEVE